MITASNSADLYYFALIKSMQSSVNPSGRDALLQNNLVLLLLLAGDYRSGKKMVVNNFSKISRIASAQ